MVVYGNQLVAAKIAQLLGSWAKWSGVGGTVTTSAGAFIREQRPGRPNVRLPDVAYTPRHGDKNLTCEQRWTYRGDPYVPNFVVETEKLSGRSSQRSALDRKMREKYFQHGVRLGWLIDPRPGFQRMYEYYLDDNGDVQCADSTEWRDLDGGDVLPGFKMHGLALDMVLNQDSGSSSEDEVDLVCPVSRCNKGFRSPSAFAAHAEWHRKDAWLKTSRDLRSQAWELEVIPCEFIAIQCGNHASTSSYPTISQTSELAIQSVVGGAD